MKKFYTFTEEQMADIDMSIAIVNISDPETAKMLRKDLSVAQVHETGYLHEFFEQIETAQEEN